MSTLLRFFLLRQSALCPKPLYLLGTGSTSPLWSGSGPFQHSRRGLSTTRALRSEEKVTVHFINRNGKKISVNSMTGISLLDVVVNQNLDFEGFGACEGTLACSTCHVIFEEEMYKTLGSIADEELDMLDLAYGLTPTSRLGCQVCLSKALDGTTVRVPEAVTDARKTNDKDSTF